MPLLKWPGEALAWLGRQGTRALATMVFIGIAVPIGGPLKPYVPEAVFLLLVLSFLRVEPAALRAHAARPLLLAAAVAWTMIALPALLLFAARGLGLDRLSPDLMLALVLQGAAAPLMSSPAIAALLGLDAALVLLGMMVCTALLPLIAPVFFAEFAARSFSLSPVILGVKLVAILAGAVLAAAAIRRLAGAAWIARQEQRIDGVNVLILFIFVVALMGDVGARAIAEPVLVIGLIVLAFALSFVLLGLTALAFFATGRREALALGLLASQRNMALMIAAAGTGIPDLTWLYFALAQFPIYMMPQMLKPLVQRLGHRRA
ncbi:MAG TPA: Na+-dependent transporter [Pseudorhodoplanes sp.]|jgi:BASS family bile acid:Na+ symporter|nr:Na+-dependent transporter [Pseudorhodoplanes sp.]